MPLRDVVGDVVELDAADGAGEPGEVLLEQRLADADGEPSPTVDSAPTVLNPEEKPRAPLTAAPGYLIETFFETFEEGFRGDRVQFPAVSVEADPTWRLSRAEQGLWILAALPVDRMFRS